jgi:hypothetical protein
MTQSPCVGSLIVQLSGWAQKGIVQTRDDLASMQIVQEHIAINVAKPTTKSTLAAQQAAQAGTEPDGLTIRFTYGLAK